MKLFGLLSLIITLAISAWLYNSSVPTLQTQGDETASFERQDIPDMLDAAYQAVDQLESTGAQVTIYDGISVSQNVTLIDLSGRRLSGSLKAEIRQLQNLRTLDISNNNFTGLPAEIGQLTQLEILNLANNPLTGLPIELANLQSLRILDVQGTQYSKQDLAVIEAGLPADTVILK